ncbi:MAG: N-acetylmuramoyl-L-alanine amidase [Lachnospiraceae bacterium]|nr:N-acetylmuramoyl-L-alanine amidase [Lachnospiraceae bacterium]
MAFRVVVDAGHGGRDPGAVFEGRQEKDDVLRLAMAVGEILENNGVEVVYTRTTDVYDTPYQKAVKGNNANADVFLSLHRNATASPGGATGIMTLVYEDTGLPAELARNINANLAALGFRDLGVIERPDLVVLRRTEAPAVLVEAGFIDNPNDNLMFDEQFNEIAAGIANGVLETLGLDQGMMPLTYYRVQTGAFRVREYADNLLMDLEANGFPAFITRGSDGLYRVQVGAFRELSNAVRMEQRLREAGYTTYITTRG